VGVSSSNPIPTPKPVEDSIMVTMTTYTVSRSQTDSNPYETA
jgi:hypothetical protein